MLQDLVKIVYDTTDKHPTKVTYFPGHGDGVLGIVHRLLVGETLRTVRGDDVGPVQGPGLQGLDQVEEGQAGPDLLVLEVSDGDAGLAGLQPLVGPLDDLGLHHGQPGAGVEPGEEGEGVGPHELPHNGQGEGGVAFLDIRTWRIQNVENAGRGK